MSYKRQKDKKSDSKLGIQTYQMLANDDEVCIPSISCILLAVCCNLVLVQDLIFFISSGTPPKTFHVSLLTHTISQPGMM